MKTDRAWAEADEVVHVSGDRQGVLRRLSRGRRKIVFMPVGQGAVAQGIVEPDGSFRLSSYGPFDGPWLATSM